MKKLKKTIIDDDESEIQSLVERDLGVNEIEDVNITEVKPHEMSLFDNKTNPKKILLRDNDSKII